MTRVYLEKDGKTYTIDCKGHAEGSPEMCAAISCLVYAVAGWTHNAKTVRHTERLTEGDVRLVFSGCEECETVFDLATVGFLQLEKLDPERVHVDVQEI